MPPTTHSPRDERQPSIGMPDSISPPIIGPASTSTVFAPIRDAAMAAATPALPPPRTTTS